MEDGMQTVTLVEVTPIAYGTWQFGGGWESVDEQAAVAGLAREGLTRHVGVSNYSTDQITEFAAVLPAETVQPPYHLFGRDIEADLLPYARAHHIGVLAYGPLARGLLGGTITEATTFGGDDWRWHSPAFTGPGSRRNLEVVAAPGRSATNRGATIAQLTVAWVLAHPAVQVAIVGSGTPAHLEESLGALDLAPSQGDLAEIDSIMAAAVPLGGPSLEGMT
jgi:aryl-alcohol dehydrogenase-like predicted oxidoreductase